MANPTFSEWLKYTPYSWPTCNRRELWKTEISGNQVFILHLWGMRLVTVVYINQSEKYRKITWTPNIRMFYTHTRTFERCMARSAMKRGLFVFHNKNSNPIASTNPISTARNQMMVQSCPKNGDFQLEQWHATWLWENTQQVANAPNPNKEQRSLLFLGAFWTHVSHDKKISCFPL